MDVFISYSHRDKKAVEKISRAITDANISVWFDKSIKVGSHISSDIQKKIRECTFCCVLWSNNSICSDYVHSEALYAHSLGKLFPLKIDNCSPPIPFNGLRTLSIDQATPTFIPELVNILKQHLSERKKLDDSTLREINIGHLDIERQVIIISLNDPDSPSDFLDKAQFEFHSLRFFPILVGNINWWANVIASIGHDHVEPYTDYEERLDSQSKTKTRIPVTKNRIVTRWQTVQVQVDGDVPINYQATINSVHVSDALRKFSTSGSYSVNQIPKKYEALIPDHEDLILSWHERDISSKIYSQIMKKLTGDRKKISHYTPSKTVEGSFIYVPLWEATIDYSGSRSHLVASGLNRNDIIFEAPKDRDLEQLKKMRHGAFVVFLGGGTFMLLIALGIFFGFGTVMLESQLKLQSPFPIWLGATIFITLVAAAQLFLRWPKRDQHAANRIVDYIGHNAEKKMKSYRIRKHNIMIPKEFMSNVRRSVSERAKLRAASILFSWATNLLALLSLSAIFLF